MDVVVQIPDETIRNALACAYGACRYWGSVGYLEDDRSGLLVLDREGDGRQHEVPRGALRNGLARLFGTPKLSRLAAQWLAGCPDHDAVDAWIQLSTFGELRYG